MKKKKKLGAILIYLLATNQIIAQDERYFRSLMNKSAVVPSYAAKVYQLNKDKNLSMSTTSDSKYKYIFKSPTFDLDIDGDGVNEKVTYVKRELEDWVVINDALDHVIFQYKLWTKGVDAQLTKIHRLSLKDDISIVVFSFREGFQHYLEYNREGRLYFLTMEKGRPDSIRMAQGPAIEWRYQDFLKRYTERTYEYEVNDIGDLVVQYGHISEVYHYVKNEGMKLWQK